MTTQFRRILVAVGDLRHAPKNELRKAAALARRSGADLELFHAITEPDPGRRYPETLAAKAVAAQRFRAATRKGQRLQQMARDPVFRGLTVRCTASWDFPPHEAIVRRAHATNADLVVAATRHHRLGARLILTNNDWELIRQCPVPVLFAKSRRPYKNPVVIAAVDPFHAHARPADLDTRLVDTGGRFAKLLRGSLHVFHAYMPLMSVEPMPGAPPIMLPPEAEEAHREVITHTVEDLATAAGVPSRRCHVCMGGVAEELAATARRLDADLVVMGAVSRSALARLFIGSAAERVLDRLSCDVLVVKPRGFKSKVLSRRAVAVTGLPGAARKPASPQYKPKLSQIDTRPAL
jgi:universal stress protein E